jgi:uncharacterized protein (DUF2461 family)
MEKTFLGHHSTRRLWTISSRDGGKMNWAGYTNFWEMKRAINRMKRRKTPGISGIPAELFQKLRTWRQLVVPYADIGRNLTLIAWWIRINSTEHCFRKMRPDSPENWRPIALLDALSKILCLISTPRLKVQHRVPLSRNHLDQPSKLKR